MITLNMHDWSQPALEERIKTIKLEAGKLKRRKPNSYSLNQLAGQVQELAALLEIIIKQNK